ncbi:hypothetical protein JCM8547_000762 [Rhodosporidiobolus lusitaniae]
MSALAQLLEHLQCLPSPSSSALRGSLSRASIRLSRAHNAWRASPTSPDLRRAVIVQLQGVQDAIDEARRADDDLLSEREEWAELAREAEEALRELERDGEDSIAMQRTASHSRTSSVDRPRRVPPSSSSTSSAQSAALDAFLARALSTSQTPSLPSAEESAAARAKELSQAYALFLMSSSSPDLNRMFPPDGQTLGDVFRSSSSASTTSHTPTSSSSAGSSSVGTLESRISEQLQAAYFDSFSSVFSSPSSTPSEKRTAWRALASDLASACLPLVPSRLRGEGGAETRARADLEEVLRASGEGNGEGDAEEWKEGKAFEALRKTVELLSRLCAPARDDDTRSILSSLLSTSSSPPNPSDLVPLVRRTLSLAWDMAADHARFRRAAASALASEEDVKIAVKEEGWSRERKAVKGIYGGEKEVKRETVKWVRETGCARVGGGEGEEGVLREAVVEALVETLFSPSAVALPPMPPSAHPAAAPPNSVTPTSTSNTLPPILLVPSQLLFTLQNRFQALVILACLVALLPPTSSVSSPSAAGSRIETEDRLVGRLWAILSSEIPSPAPFPPAPSSSSSDFLAPFPPSSTPSDAGDGGTRLLHLADEVLTHMRNVSPSSSAEAGEAEEKRIRASVERILRTEDPVFRLLAGRLRGAVKGALLEAVSSSPSSSSAATTAEALPAHLRTGRSLASSATSSSPLHPLRNGSTPSTLPPLTPAPPPIKGFDRPQSLAALVSSGLLGTPVLPGGAGEAGDAEGGGVKDVWEWVEGAWDAVLGWRSEGR